MSGSHPELAESASRLELRSPMRVRVRVLLAALALVPLIAPYELLVRVRWEHYLNPFFLLAAFISAGATAVSAFLFFAAVAGLSSRMVFDREAAMFTYSQEAPVVRRTKRVHALADVCGVDIGVGEWSDSAPTYHLAVSMSDGTVYASGYSWSREDIESIRVRVNRFLAAESP